LDKARDGVLFRGRVTLKSSTPFHPRQAPNYPKKSHRHVFALYLHGTLSAAVLIASSSRRQVHSGKVPASRPTRFHGDLPAPWTKRTTRQWTRRLASGQTCALRLYTLNSKPGHP